MTASLSDDDWVVKGLPDKFATTLPGSNGNDEYIDESLPPKEFWIFIVAIALIASSALSLVAMTLMSRSYSPH